MKTAKGLSIHQPWAKLIYDGRKTIELRTWRTSYRGPLVICPSKKVDKEALAHFSKYGFCALDEQFPGGFAMTIVELTDCRPMTRDDEKEAWHRHEPGTYAWILKNRLSDFPPFKIRGRQGLFNVEIKPRILMAEYCPGEFYMGWWLYERDRPDGSINDWLRLSPWGWLDMEHKQREVFDLCRRLGHEDLPEPKGHSQDFAEAFSKRFPEGIKVSRVRGASGEYQLFDSEVAAIVTTGEHR